MGITYMFTDLMIQEKFQLEIENNIYNAKGSLPDTWKWLTDDTGKTYFIEKNSNRRRYGKIINCESCNRQICVRTNSTYKTCSQTCSAHLTKVEKLKLNCSTCQKNLFRRQSDLANSKSGLYFCDRKCKEKAQQIGGLKEIQPDHYGEGVSAYSIRALREYGSKCSDCSATFKPILLVHHIDGDRENGDIKNLEVLCHNHHALRHMMYDAVRKIWILNYKFLTPRDKLKEISILLS